MSNSAFRQIFLALPHFLLCLAIECVPSQDTELTLRPSSRGAQFLNDIRKTTDRSTRFFVSYEGAGKPKRKGKGKKSKHSSTFDSFWGTRYRGNAKMSIRVSQRSR